MRQLIRQLPPLRWRDERIRELRATNRTQKARLEALSAELAEWRARAEEEPRRDGVGAPRTGPKGLPEAAGGPSFQYMLESERRIAVVRRKDGPAPLRISLAGKLYSQSIARAAGVRVPAIYGIWNSIEEIDLAALPEEFVLKSDRGSNSKGVFPIVRAGDRYQIAGIAEPVTAEQVLDRLREAKEARRAPAPYFAEQYLHGREDGEVPPDIKVYAFYGEIGHVHLRAVGRHADNSSVVSKFVDADGTDLGAIDPSRTIDPTLALPEAFEEVVQAARTLSKAAKVPFIRVDLYETADGICFGEYTTRPGGTQWYGVEHDRVLGKRWERAQSRLDADRTAGMPLEPDTLEPEDLPSSRRPSTDRIARRVHVAGHVQGVGYRMHCSRTAERLGVAGWVRNLPDGAVQAWVEGAPDAVGSLLDWLATGPRNAEVTGTQITEEDPQGLSSFEIRR
ncbi:acylphosphatase [Ruania alba]|uniref:acylphosphatase n=1 Tax=Ruania alba TaxID=648782 RepID=UPI00111350C4|nr:ATP-grasp fold amidoligase family protein [Ruania alba]